MDTYKTSFKYATAFFEDLKDILPTQKATFSAI